MTESYWRGDELGFPRAKPHVQGAKDVFSQGGRRLALDAGKQMVRTSRDRNVLLRVARGFRPQGLAKYLPGILREGLLGPCIRGQSEQERPHDT